ncbi:MAG TPA: hypothetical protein VNH22_10800 [Blastocatellia bacterium]|nr:hypothetical protein [Blastocatellia bacterium]
MNERTVLLGVNGNWQGTGREPASSQTGEGNASHPVVPLAARMVE